MEQKVGEAKESRQTEEVLENDGKSRCQITNVTLQLWFSVECAVCTSSYSPLYN